VKARRLGVLFQRPSAGSGDRAALNCSSKDGDRTGARGLHRLALATVLGFAFLASAASSAHAAFEHPQLPALSHSGFTFADAVAVDASGDTYVSDFNGSISIFAPGGEPITTVSGFENPVGLAVDGTGNLYVASSGAVRKYNPAGGSPPVASTTYSLDTSLNGTGILSPHSDENNDVAVDTVTGRIYVVSNNRIAEYKPDGSLVAEGTGQPSQGEESIAIKFASVAVDSSTGTVYAATTEGRDEVRAYEAGNFTEPILTINGAKTPAGILGLMHSGFGEHIAVDEAAGILYVFDGINLLVNEFSAATGRYLGQFQNPTFSDGEPTGLAVAPPSAPNSGDVFVAALGELSAFSTSQVPGAPFARTEPASDNTTTTATAHGIVVPEGAELESCAFQFGETEGYGEVLPCSASPAAIGSGYSEVAVQSQLTGLAPSKLYHYRLVVFDGLGLSFGEDRTVATGPAIGGTRSSEIGTDSARLEADINPNGEATTYQFAYVSQAQFESSGFSNASFVPDPALPVNEGNTPITVGAGLDGLSPSTVYYFRAVATNGAGTIGGAINTFETFGGESPQLPDGRAYELVSPPDTGGKFIVTLQEDEKDLFSTWNVSPSGESVIFNTEGVLNGAEGTGTEDAYESVRGATGWTVRAFDPTGVQAVSASQGGVSPDHGYSFWVVRLAGGTLDVSAPAESHYLRVPTGTFEPIGVGALGQDLTATGRWLTTDGTHIIFTGSAVQLESDAPPAGTEAVYDRSAGGPTYVVSLLPGDVTPSTPAEYMGTSADGTAVAFRNEGKLYERRNDAVTYEVAGAGAEYEGLSTNGSTVFYKQGGNVFAFEAADQTAVPIGSGGASTVVNISGDGSHVYFSSPALLDGLKGTVGERNLYVWDEAGVSFIATLDPRDFAEFGPEAQSGNVNLGTWHQALDPRVESTRGRADDPSRTTPDGSVLVFQSHAVAGYPYDSEGFSEVYRYDSVAKSLTCLSCDRGAGGSSSEAELQSTGNTVGTISPVNSQTYIQNVTNNGQTVFFQSREALVLGDTDGFNDVYEWNAGQVSLISSGHSTSDDFLFGMSNDGANVFFKTGDKLLSQDVTEGAGSIYDARIGGGFPQSPLFPSPCVEAACQGPGSPAPVLPTPGTSSGEPPGVKHHRPKKHHRKKHHQKRYAGKSQAGPGRAGHANRSSHSGKPNRGGAK
jgi:hypothetical protein